MFEKLFGKSINLKNIQKSVLDHKDKVDSLIQEIKMGKSFKEKYIDIIMEINTHSNLYIWKKDKDHLYEFSNIAYMDFLGVPLDFADEMIGMSDKEVSKSVKNCVKNLHKICLLTDKITEKSKIECNFIEGNFGKQILSVTKIPIMVDNIFQGSIGVARKCEDKKMISIFLNKMIKEFGAENLYGDLKKLFCYRIFDRRIRKKIFF